MGRTAAAIFALAVFMWICVGVIDAGSDEIASDPLQCYPNAVLYRRSSKQALLIYPEKVFSFSESFSRAKEGSVTPVFIQDGSNCTVVGDKRDATTVRERGACQHTCVPGTPTRVMTTVALAPYEKETAVSCPIKIECNHELWDIPQVTGLFLVLSNHTLFENVSGEISRNADFYSLPQGNITYTICLPYLADSNGEVHVNIRAATVNDSIFRVRFHLKFTPIPSSSSPPVEWTNVDSRPPFALVGDIDGKFKDWGPEFPSKDLIHPGGPLEGEYVISAVATRNGRDVGKAYITNLLVKRSCVLKDELLPPKVEEENECVLGFGAGCSEGSPNVIDALQVKNYARERENIERRYKDPHAWNLPTYVYFVAPLIAVLAALLIAWFSGRRILSCVPLTLRGKPYRYLGKKGTPCDVVTPGGGRLPEPTMAVGLEKEARSRPSPRPKK